ncbi:hypothetical protein [Sulfuracidifex tepidarius]|uniref:hypothetical protein n=1 Tax=Sulfuracidifex tepidarius TaxID=1294262 RepID=UPI0011F1B4D2|nr:hypothetical protein [Sulfuracidifex tepidarius]
MNADKIVILKMKEFSKLGRENVIKVIARERPSEMSKSYYYFTLNKLKSLGLMRDNSISFKATIPITGDYSHLKGILYVTENKNLIYINLEVENGTHCVNCALKESCLYAVKTIAKETDIKLRRENIRQAWEELIEEAWRRVVENSVSMNVPVSQTDLVKESS